MYWLRLGYWNNHRGFGQTASIYIFDDFKAFLMEDWDNETDKECYIKNSIPQNIRYDKKVQPMIEHFADIFDEINSEEDISKLKGVIDFEKFEVELPY